MEGVQKMFRRASESIGKPRKVELVYVVVSPTVKQSVEKLAKAMGVSVSEYVRRLILEDLDKRSLFTTKLKGEFE
jgi:hypothetical protein